MTNGARLSGITIDCADPQPLATFWSGLLGGDIGEPLPGWARLESDGMRPEISFQPVAEPKVGKTRIHLDVTVDDIDAGAQRVTELGGASLGQRYVYDEGVVMTMADPEGNEFCIVQYL